MPIPISWTPGVGSKVSRRCVHSGARRGHDDVTLNWLHQWCPELTYRVRWWEGPDAHTGQWKEQDTATGTSLREVKAFASMIAGTVTPWPVEVNLHGRAHTPTGYDSSAVVWAFGHYQRETDEAKTTRGRP